MLLVAAAFALAVLSSRVSERVSLPGPALFLLAAAVLSDVFPSLGKLQIRTVERIGVVALIVILFDGGTRIGLRRLRTALGARAAARPSRDVRDRGDRRARGALAARLLVDHVGARSAPRSRRPIPR